MLSPIISNTDLSSPNSKTISDIYKCESLRFLWEQELLMAALQRRNDVTDQRLAILLLKLLYDYTVILHVAVSPINL